MSVSILIIEDEPELQESLSHVLQEAGYCVEAVGDGLLAIASARKKSPYPTSCKKQDTASKQ